MVHLPDISRRNLVAAMKLIFLAIGSRHESYVQPGVDEFTRRIQHYMPCEWKILPGSKHGSPEQVRHEESKSMLQQWQKHEAYQVLLDERGKLLSSPGFAESIAKAALQSRRAMCFSIGGAFGVSDELRAKADLVLSFGKMVFPHQLVRLMLAEQVYRACTINRGEKYHHV